MYLCDELGINTFIVGDEKQSIYMWRGAYPKAFKGIWEKSNFEKRVMSENFRSCQQIQNYSNLLCKETRDLFCPIDVLDSIVLITALEEDWMLQVAARIDSKKKSALLRYKQNDANIGAKNLSKLGVEYIYIPPIPIADIAADTAWLYTAIAKYLVVEGYSVYDFIYEIPAEGDDSRKTVSTIKNFLDNIKCATSNEDCFCLGVIEFFEYMGCSTKKSYLGKLFKTVSNTSFHVAFSPEKYNHVAMTIHSSKGLEFEQVIVFAEDYALSNIESIYNHYVAVTRARSKLIIVRIKDSDKADKFQNNIEKILDECRLTLGDIVSI